MEAVINSFQLAVSCWPQGPCVQESYHTFAELIKAILLWGPGTYPSNKMQEHVLCLLRIILISQCMIADDLQ